MSGKSLLIFYSYFREPPDLELDENLPSSSRDSGKLIRRKYIYLREVDSPSAVRVLLKEKKLDIFLTFIMWLFFVFSLQLKASKPNFIWS